MLTVHNDQIIGLLSIQDGKIASRGISGLESVNGLVSMTPIQEKAEILAVKKK
jgi:hypothetical protein